MTRAIVASLMLASGAAAFADEPPPRAVHASGTAACEGKSVGDVCTSRDGSESVCTEAKKRTASTLKNDVPRLICPNPGRGGGEKSHRALLIAGACAAAAIAIVIAGSGWLKPPAAEGAKPPEENKSA